MQSSHLHFDRSRLFFHDLSPNQLKKILVDCGISLFSNPANKGGTASSLSENFPNRLSSSSSHLPTAIGRANPRPPPSSHQPLPVGVPKTRLEFSQLVAWFRARASRSTPIVSIEVSFGAPVVVVAEERSVFRFASAGDVEEVAAVAGQEEDETESTRLAREAVASEPTMTAAVMVSAASTYVVRATKNI